MTAAIDEIAGLARDLVAIPSHGDETAAGDRLERWLRMRTDATVHRDDAGNVIARRGGEPAGLALVGHHDVVPPAASQLDGDEYAIDERDGRLYGRGTADMKGALAAMCCAFRDATIDGDVGGGLALASFVGEETGGDGARHAIETGFAPDRAIVCEGSTGYSAAGVTDVAVGHKGRRASTFTVHGRAAHASEPAAGENAIDRACEVVRALRDLDLPTATVLGHDLAGSVAVTGIEGGSAWNVVPDRCTVTVDERTVPDARLPLEGLTDEHVEWTVEQDLPPMACDDAAFAETALDVARQAQSSPAAHVVKPHATDAGWLARAGTSCLVCGPAEPGEAHTADESVALDVLARCETIYRRAAERLLA